MEVLHNKRRFYQLSVRQRLDVLLAHGILDPADTALLLGYKNDQILAVNARCSENVLGSWPLPFATVPDFVLNERSYNIPLVTEETSVVAALNKASKWVRCAGTLGARTLASGCWGQLLYLDVACVSSVQSYVTQHNMQLVDYINQKCAPSMHARGGGCRRIRTRVLADGTLSVDFLMDTVDAMGANLINQVANRLAVHITSYLPNAKAISILSNHQPEALFEATCELGDIPEDMATRIQQLSNVALVDPYRAVTHNKGIMNGVDAVLLATGNDTRAAAAAVHAYASESGQYKGIARWSYRGGVLQGVLRMPIPCGVVGGITKVHPMAQLALKLLGVSTKAELGEVVCAVGLMQNLAALRALVAEGIVPGHMRLHIDNLLMSVGTDSDTAQAIWGRCFAYLQANGGITEQDVVKFVREYQKDKM